MTAITQNKIALVRKLYFVDKLTAAEIAARLGVGLDSVYYFMRRNKLPRRSFSAQNSLRFERKAPSFKIKMALDGKERELRAMGAMLYWAEGFQAEHANLVDFANSKPEMIAVFLRFLREICGINEKKLRVYLYCYSNQNVANLITFWSNLTKIPKKQFTKPYVRSDFDKQKLGKMPRGLIHIRYGDKKLLQLLREWIDGYSRKFGL